MKFWNNYSVTLTFILINVVIFAGLNIVGTNFSEANALAREYLSVGHKSIHGEYWGFITSLFTHVHIAHIFGNTLGLLAFGTLAERYFGKLIYLSSYLICGVFASIYTIVQSSSPGGQYGASGCVFGLVGMLLVYSILNPEKLFYARSMSKVFYGITMLIYVGGAMIASHELFRTDLVSALWGFGSYTWGFIESTHGGGFIIGLLFGMVLVLGNRISKRSIA
jgi:membrane associated rhomboid family serine protease